MGLRCPNGCRDGACVLPTEHEYICDDGRDNDSDGLTDTYDPDCSTDDSDNDGVPNVNDNCPYTPNPGQEDADDDQIGDVCDNCPAVANTDQEDRDGDGFGNACDPEKIVFTSLLYTSKKK